MSTNEASTGDIEIRVIRTDAMEIGDLDMVHRLFDLSYRQANHSYL